MMSESSNAPFLRCFSAFASHRETNGVADAMIEAEENVVIHHVGGRALTVDIFRYQ